MYLIFIYTNCTFIKNKAFNPQTSAAESFTPTVQPCSNQRLHRPSVLDCHPEMWAARGSEYELRASGEI